MHDPRPSLDVLAFAAHPDDVELSCGGTMCLLQAQGYTTGIVDLTRGERGTRGTPETRAAEAAAASEILGVSARENLGMPDGDVAPTPERILAVAAAIRRHRPRVVLLNAPDDRHPDHGNAARLVAEAIFTAGLAAVETPGPSAGSGQAADGAPLAPWRPHHALHYMQSIEFTPTFVVDVTPVWDRRTAALRAFESQFDAAGGGPQTFLTAPGFIDWVEARARSFGYRIGATYGEPLLYRHGPVGVTDLMTTLGREVVR